MNVINFNTHDCKSVRDHLDSYINNELLVETCHEVLKHLESCEDCSREMEERLRAKDLLKKAVKRDAAPAELKERIQRELYKKSAPAWRYWAAAAAMITLLAAGLGAARLWRSPAASKMGAQILKVGLDDHVHCAVERQFAERRFSTEEMSYRLGAEYFGLVPLVEQEVPGEYDVVVGHRCRTNKREYVHLILKSSQTAVSLVITRKEGESFERSDLPAVLGASGVPVYRSPLEGYEVTGFETRDYLAFVVSDAAGADNLQVASGLAVGVRDFLARLET
jgi:anti-sigma factor (TIGR02949 family)